MTTMEIKINDDIRKEIQASYNKKEALHRLIQKTDIKEGEAFSYIIEKYEDASSDLSLKLDAIEKDVLQSLYKSFIYSYEIQFSKNTIALQISDTNDQSIIANLEKIGWKLSI